LILRTSCSVSRTIFVAAEFFPIRKEELAGMTGVSSLTHVAENRESWKKSEMTLIFDFNRLTGHFGVFG